MIKKITVETLWGSFQLSTEFRKKVTIFAGNNGSFKSSLLDLLSAALRVDYDTLINYEFSRIIVTLGWDEAEELIVSRKVEEKGISIVCKLGEMAESVYFIPGEELRTGLYYGNEQSPVAKKIKERITVSWLPEFRTARSSRYGRKARPARLHRESADSPINRKLDALMDRMANYLLSLNEQNNANIKTLQKDILTQMWSAVSAHEINDSLPIQEENIGEAQATLIKLFKTLNFPPETVEDILHKMTQLRKTLAAGNDQSDEVAQLYLRTRKLAESFVAYDSERKRIFKYAFRFIETLNEFMPGKEFEFKSGHGNGQKILDITLKGTSTHLELADLSSGEKQLIVLLAESLLQAGKPSLLIADEPELSLHISWQRKILRAILRLNPDVQIVVATHAPEIAAAFPENVINMKSVIRS